MLYVQKLLTNDDHGKTAAKERVKSFLPFYSAQKSWVFLGVHHNFTPQIPSGKRLHNELENHHAIFHG